MAEAVPEGDAQALQHFLSQSEWDWEPVIAQVATEADTLVGGMSDSCLILDETTIPKKGTKSVGLARQWCGALDKVDNCQLGVFAGLSQGRDVTLVDARLYLPKEWVNSPKRSRQAGVPEADRVSKSKVELALEMITSARRRGLRFEWIAADGAYGQDPALLRALDEAAETFVMDVHRDQPVYLEDPELKVPAKTAVMGRPKSRPVAQTPKSKLCDWVQQQPESAWRRVFIRHSTRGPLEVEVLHHRAWAWNGKEASPHHWHAFATREIGSPSTIKYGLSNAPEDTSAQCLAQMQRQRYWIERAFQDAKNTAGLDEYQARGWKAWHHHTALVMMAMLFMLQQKLEHRETNPLLSSADIKLLLARFLPQPKSAVDEVIEQMEYRHKQRQRAIDSAYKRRLRSPPGNLTK